MSSHLSIPAVAVLALLGHGELALAQAQRAAIYASVLDRDGKPVASVDPTDLVVREDNVTREILAITPATDPLRIAVLVDTSQAMQPHIANLRDALRAFVARTAGRHAVSLVSFGERPTVLADYTRDAARLQNAAQRVFAQPGAGAHLLDAIIEVAGGLRSQEGARSALVVVTGEGPEFSGRYHMSAVDAVRDAGATLHSLVLSRRGVDFRGEAAREREFAVAKGARLTGGRIEQLLTSMALRSRLEALADELNHQHRVEYATTGAADRAEKVHVMATRPELYVRASRIPGKEQ